MVTGIANAESISAGCAAGLHANGYHSIATYLNHKALPHVEEVTDTWGVEVLLPFQVSNGLQLDAIEDRLRSRGLRLAVFLHGIAFASEIRNERHDVTWKSFMDSTRISAFSMVEITSKLFKEDVFNPGGCILSLSYSGSHLAVSGYNMMGPVKSILEALVRGLASELGGKGIRALADSLGQAKRIRVNGISPGFVPTYSISKVGNSLDILEREKNRSPLKTNVRKEDIASLAASILENKSVTAMIYPIDAVVGAMEH